MGGCRCSYKSCRSATKTTENLHFFHYPVKHRERCAIWIKNADKPEFADLPDYQLRNKVICGLHFEDKYFANTEKRRLVHNAIPSLNAGCDDSVDVSYIEELEILPSSNDGNTFTMQIDDIQPGPSLKKQKLNYLSNGKFFSVKKMSKQPEIYTIDPSYFNQSFYNNSNIKEVVINSASAKEEEELDEENCMTMYDNHDSDSLSTEKPDMDYNESGEDDNKIQNLFSDQEENSRSGELDDSKENLHLSSDIGENTNASLDSNDVSTHESSNGSQHSPVTSLNLAKQQMKRIQNSTVVVNAALDSKTIKPTTSTTAIRLTNTNLLRCLKNRLPDSLLGAISMHLNKRRHAITLEEQEYASAMSSVPMTGRTILRNCGWIMPTNNS